MSVGPTAVRPTRGLVAENSPITKYQVPLHPKRIMPTKFEVLSKIVNWSEQLYSYSYSYDVSCRVVSQVPLVLPAAARLAHVLARAALVQPQPQPQPQRAALLTGRSFQSIF